MKNSHKRWKPISQLKRIKKDINEIGYYNSYFNIKEIDGNVYYRKEPIQSYAYPKEFHTQYGTFINHNNGEFKSWMEMPDKSFRVDGNFIDQFDCGPYSYAVSNLLHMLIGDFQLLRLDKNLKSSVIFNNEDIEQSSWDTVLQYIGRYENSQGIMVIISVSESDSEWKEYTLLLQVDFEGNCTLAKRINESISDTFSIVTTDSYIYLGQKRTITRLDPNKGEIIYFSNN